jgi:hypothetical protein
MEDQPAEMAPPPAFTAAAAGTYLREEGSGFAKINY